MRFINLEELAATNEVQQFLQMEQNYLQQMQGMTDAERKEFVRSNTDWNLLQEIMFNLSGSKCWYSEAPPGAGDYEIDHFRPKNRSKQFDGTVLKTHGYWWLAYNWRNYRLAGGLVNKRRKDRLGSDEEVKGKGDYFPLDIVHGSIVANQGDNLNHELPILLDPTNIYDTSLISFDKDGTPIVQADASESDKFRANKSIYFYHLDMEQLSLYRKQVWKKCEDELGDIHEAVTNAPNEHTRRAILKKACKTLHELTRFNAPFSKVGWACIDANTDKYSSWLKQLKVTLVN